MAREQQKIQRLNKEMNQKRPADQLPSNLTILPPVKLCLLHTKTQNTFFKLLTENL